jgi:hypothetical protein
MRQQKTKHSRSLVARQSIIWRSYVDFNRHNNGQTNKKKKSRLSVFLSIGWTAFCTFIAPSTYSHPHHPFPNNPALPNPQNTAFLSVKTVRCAFYFKLCNDGYYLSKNSRDSSVSIVTWVWIGWSGFEFRYSKQFISSHRLQTALVPAQLLSNG